nr:SHOCT domain-containing protein [Pseudomaricurvus alcaniphilus]
MDVSGEIRSLDKLRQDGLITDSEFEEQKRKILDRSP